MKKHLLNLRMAVIGMGMLFSTTLSAATFTAITSGNWSSAATWGGTAPSGNVSNDNIIIGNGITVTMDMDVTFTGNLILPNTLNVDGTLTSNTNNSLNITQGSLTGAGTISIRRINFSNTALSAFTGTMNVGTMSSSALTLGLVGAINVADSLILESGALTLNNASNITLSANSTIRRSAGSLSISGGIFNTTNVHNVMYTGTSKTSALELSGSSVQNVWIKMSSGTQSMTLANDFILNGDLHLVTGKMDMSGRKLTLKGDLFASATSSITSNSTSELIIEGTGAMTNGLMFEAGSSVNNLTVNRAGNSTVKLMSSLAVAGHLHLMNGIYSLENGSTLTMNAASMIHVEGGSLATNSGNFVGTAAYNVEYSGAASSTNSGPELSGSGLHDVSINYASTTTNKMVLTTDATINGELKMMNGMLDLNGKDLTLNGTMSQSSTGTGFIGNNNSGMTLNLTSVSSNTLMFDAANRNLSKLKINLGGASTSSIMLGSALVIGNELSFTKGRIAIGTGGDLIIQPTGTITGYDDTKYIITSSTTGAGRLQMNITAASASYVTFPVGTSDNYSPAHIKNTTAGNFMVGAGNEFLASGTTGTDLSATMSVVKRTWHIDAASGTAVNMNLKLSWMAASEVNTFNRNSAVLRHYTNGAWDVTGAVTATAGANSTFEVSRDNITSLSPFGVTDANTTVGIKQVASSSSSFDVYPNPAKDAISVKASTTAKFELIDITGRTLAVTSATDGTIKFDLSKLEKGYYFVKMTDLENNTTATKRFIKD